MATKPNATRLEQAAVNALLDLLNAAHQTGDVATVRTTARALHQLADTYNRRQPDPDTEAANMPAVDMPALRQAASDHYTLATFIADNPDLAERSNIMLPHYGDPFDNAIEKVIYWRSQKQIAIDEARNVEYQREYAERKAREAAEKQAAEDDAERINEIASAN